MSAPQFHPPNQDLEHLRLLAIFHYVVAGIAALFATFPVLHLVAGITMLTGTFDPQNPNFPSPVFGWFFVIVATAAISLGWTFAICALIAGRSLKHRRRYRFCLIVAGLACAFMPFGTVLGVFTILVLVRPSVKELFSNPLIQETTGD